MSVTSPSRSSSAPCSSRTIRKEIKAFYMRLNDDGKTVAAADCLVPGIGEIIGGSQREERIELLEKRIRELGMNPEDYWWYCDLRPLRLLPSRGLRPRLRAHGDVFNGHRQHPRCGAASPHRGQRRLLILQKTRDTVPCPLFFENYTPLRALPPKGRLRHARGEKSFLARACRAKKRFEIISRLRTRKAVTL